MNWMENCSFVGHYIFMKMWWKCVHVFDTCFLAHFIWKFPPPKINSEGSVLVTVMSSVLVYLGLLSKLKLLCLFVCFLYGYSTGSLSGVFTIRFTDEFSRFFQDIQKKIYNEVLTAQQLNQNFKKWMLTFLLQ